jgi:nitrous oxidase accessory protein NosD
MYTPPEAAMRLSVQSSQLGTQGTKPSSAYVIVLLIAAIALITPCVAHPSSLHASIVDSLRLVNHLGGYTHAITAHGTSLLVGTGNTIHTYDISGGLPVQAGVFRVADGLEAEAIVTEGNLAYVAYGFRWIGILDITNPASPVQLSAIQLPQMTTMPGLWSIGLVKTSVHGSALVCCGEDGIVILDVTNPSQAQVVQYIPVKSIKVAIKDSTGYFLNDENGQWKLYVLNLGNPAVPVQLANVNLPVMPENLAVDANNAYITTLAGIYIYSIANPSIPVQSRILDPGRNYNGVLLNGGRLLATYDIGNSPDGLASFNTLDAGATLPEATLVLGTNVQRMTLTNGWLYLTTGQGMSRVNVSQAGVLPPENAFPIPWDNNGLAAGNDLLYITDLSGLYRYDYSTPDSPSLMNHYPQFSGRMRPVLSGDLLLSLDLINYANMTIVNLSNPANPVLMATYTPPGGDVAELAMHGNLALLCTSGPNALHVIDITQPGAPNRIGGLALAKSPKRIAVHDSSKTVYVASYDGTSLSSIDVISLANPANPTMLKTLQWPNEIRAMTIDKNTLYIGIVNMNDSTTAILAYTVKNPDSMDIGGYMEFPGTLWDIAVKNSEMFLSYSSGRLQHMTYVGPGSKITAKQGSASMGGYVSRSSIAVPSLADLVVSAVQQEYNISASSGYTMFTPNRYSSCSEGVYIFTTRPLQPPARKKLTTSLQPPNAGVEGCTVDPSPGEHVFDINTWVPLKATAEASKGWNFTKWSGDVNTTDASTSVTMNTDKTAIANFVQPVLVLSGGTGGKFLCPYCNECFELKQNVSDTVLVFRLCTDEDDGWSVNSVKVVASGTGHEADDIASVVLTMDDVRIDSTKFTADDGQLTLQVNKVIPRSSCRTFRVIYNFVNNPARFPQLRTFSLTTNSSLVDAKPQTYATGLKLPSAASPVQGGPLQLGPVYNVTRQLLYSTISESTADAHDMDSIIVCPGWYKENIAIHKKTSVASISGPMHTTIEASNKSNPAISLTGGNVVLRGFGITRSAPGIFSDWIIEFSNVGIYDCDIYGNKPGAQISVHEGLRMKDNCRVHDNDSGGVWLNHCFNALVSYCSFTANRGYGVFVDHSSADISHCLVASNKLDGIVMSLARGGSIMDSKIEENNGWGVYAASVIGESGFGAMITDNSIIRNHSGGIYIDGSGLIITRNKFFGNCSTDESYLSDNGTLSIGPASNLVSIKDNTLQGNSGSGIILENMLCSEINRNTISNNTGHGIRCKHALSNTIENNKVTNHLEGQYAIWASRHSNLILKQNIVNANINGVLINNSHDVKALGNVIEYNFPSTSGPGGVGLHLLDDFNSLISGNQINRNVTGLRLDSSNAIDITGNHIWYNRRKAFDAEGSEYTMTNNSIWFNSVPFLKGDIGGLSVSASNGSIRGNSIGCNEGDGLLFQNGSNGFVHNNFIAQNNAAGLRNMDDAVTIDASYNWWDDVTGPGGEGPGNGDEVFGNVNYTPWLSAPAFLVLNATRDSAMAAAGDTIAMGVSVMSYGTAVDSVELTVSDTRGWLMAASARHVLCSSDSPGQADIALAIPVDAVDGQTDVITCIARSLRTAAAPDTVSMVCGVIEPRLDKWFIVPDSIDIAVNGDARFTTLGLDQLGRIMQRRTLWSCTGGTIDSTNMYTAGTQTGMHSVTATDSATGMTAAAKVWIYDLYPSISRLRIVPAAPVVAVNDSVQIGAIRISTYNKRRVADPVWTAAGGVVTGDWFHAGPQTGEFTLSASDGSAWGQVTVRIVPRGFTLISPPDASTELPLPVNLEWQAHPLAVVYHLQVGLDQSFVKTIVDDSTIYRNSYNINSNNLAGHANTTLYWRVFVVTVAGDTLIVSPVWTFKTRSLAPSAVVLRYPVDGSIRLPLSLQCMWNTDPAFVKYRFWLSTDPAFTSVVRSGTELVGGVFALDSLQHKSTYYWKVEGQTSYGGLVQSPVWSFTTKDTTSTDVPAAREPADFILFANHPNPFHSSTIISYALPVPSAIVIGIHAMDGRRIARYEHQYESAGLHHVEWNAAGLPSGAYIIRIAATPLDGRPIRTGVLRAVLLRN